MTFQVAVPGGTLAVHELNDAAPEAPLVVGLHGITANALSWGRVAGRLDGLRFVAPDLRGRADSRAIDGPWGITEHADDVVRVLDHLDATDAVLVGHSMGAFVAATAAARHPDRVRAGVLVDGGVALPMPAGTDIDAVLQAVIGPAMQRLSMRFTGPDDYLDFWRRHPAIGPLFDTDAHGTLETYLRHDLVADGDGFRSTCVLDAVRADGADVLTDPEVLGALDACSAPMAMLWAARGLLDEPQGMYDAQRIAAAAVPDRVVVREVPGTNHYSVLLAPDGVTAICAAVRSGVDA